MVSAGFGYLTPRFSLQAWFGVIVFIALFYGFIYRPTVSECGTYDLTLYIPGKIQKIRIYRSFPSYPVIPNPARVSPIFGMATIQAGIFGEELQMRKSGSYTEVYFAIQDHSNRFFYFTWNRDGVAIHREPPEWYFPEFWEESYVHPDKAYRNPNKRMHLVHESQIVRPDFTN